MERRIKLLYIITIIVMCASLGMQLYWMYGRYATALNDYESRLAATVVATVDSCKRCRGRAYDSSKSGESQRVMTFPSYKLESTPNDKGKSTRRVGIFVYKLNLDQLKDGEIYMLKKRVVEEAVTNSKNIVDSVYYDASGAVDDNEAWNAAHSVYIERNHPLDVATVDSALIREGVDAEIAMRKLPGTVWKNSVKFGGSKLRPLLRVEVPVSQLEGKVVVVTCRISAFAILPQIWTTIMCSLIVFVLLAICLAFQIATVRKLTRIDRMRESFVSTMIHELKRPVSTLKMCVSCLENDKMTQSNEERGELLAETRSALDNLSAYFSKLRDITFNDSEQIPLNLQSVHLCSFMDSLIATTILPTGKVVEIVNETDAAVVLHADRSHLQNIMNNLVENALKYSGQNVRIVLRGVDRGDHVEIEVIDNGNGISERDIPQVFNRFYRGEAAFSSLPGMGLGLAYIKLLVEAHGGSATVVSRVGEGSRFIITFPKLG